MFIFNFLWSLYWQALSYLYLHCSVALSSQGFLFSLFFLVFLSSCSQRQRAACSNVAIRGIKTTITAALIPSVYLTACHLVPVLMECLWLFFMCLVFRLLTLLLFSRSWYPEVFSLVDFVLLSFLTFSFYIASHVFCSLLSFSFYMGSDSSSPFYLGSVFTRRHILLFGYPLYLACFSIVSHPFFSLVSWVQVLHSVNPFALYLAEVFTVSDPLSFLQTPIQTQTNKLQPLVSSP